MTLPGTTGVLGLVPWVTSSNRLAWVCSHVEGRGSGRGREDVQTPFKPLLALCLLTCYWPRQVTQSPRAGTARLPEPRAGSRDGWVHKGQVTSCKATVYQSSPHQTMGGRMHHPCHTKLQPFLPGLLGDWVPCTSGWGISSPRKVSQ